jgi:hypothetical protein
MDAPFEIVKKSLEARMTGNDTRAANTCSWKHGTAKKRNVERFAIDAKGSKTIYKETITWRTPRSSRRNWSDAAWDGIVTLAFGVVSVLTLWKFQS